MVDQEVGSGAGEPSPISPASYLTGIELRHAIPGRVRLRFPGIKGQPALAREIEQQLAALPVIRRVEVSPVTGSVLVVYDPADSEAIAGLGRMMIPDLDLDAMNASRPATSAHDAQTGSPSEVVANYARQLNAKLVEASGRAADLRFVVPASLFVGGLARLIATRKVVSPAWYDFLWFAFGTYCALNPVRREGRPAEANGRRTTRGGRGG